ncbi:MAG: metallophosphoesterase [Polyangiaceae bacterium]
MSLVPLRSGPSWFERHRLKIAFFLPVILLLYAVSIEPAWIETTHHRVTLGLKKPIKLAHLTDLHTKELGRREERLLALLEQEAPDAIVITGDSVHGDGSFEDAARVIAKMHAPLGVWITPGNWEGWIPNGRRFDVLRRTGAHVLVNEVGAIREDLWLMGLDDLLSGQPKTDGLANRAPKEAHLIALVHEPVLFERLAGVVPLVLAGHTHGGQARLPFLPPLWLPPGSGDYVEGWFEAKGSKMYVSRGIGNSLLEIRFNCRPELAIVNVE